MFSFLCDLICGNTETRNRINDLRHNLNRENNLIIKKYLKDFVSFNFWEVLVLQQ